MNDSNIDPDGNSIDLFDNRNIASNNLESPLYGDTTKTSEKDSKNSKSFGWIGTSIADIEKLK